MSSEHKAPFAAFLVVSIACVVVLANALRSDALAALHLAAPVPVIAGELLLPDADRGHHPTSEEGPAAVEYVVAAPPAEDPAPLSRVEDRSTAAPPRAAGIRRDREQDRGRQQAEKPAGEPERPGESETGQTRPTLASPTHDVTRTGQPSAAAAAPHPGSGAAHANDHAHGRGDERGKGHGARGGDRRTWGDDAGQAATAPAWGPHHAKHEGSAHGESPHADEDAHGADPGTDEQPGVGHGRD